MLISLDGRGTLQEQIARALRSAVLSRRLAAGQRLPGTRALSRQLGVSRNVTMFAVEQLVAEGYLTARPGSGTYVTGRLPDHLTRADVSAVPAGDPSRPAVDIDLSAFAQRLGAGPAGWRGVGQGLDCDFRYGLAVPDGRSIAAWRQIQARRNRRPPFDYGAAAGAPALRQAIAEVVCPRRGLHPRPDQVIVVGGAQQALYLSTRLLIDPGDRVLLEEPHYQGARELFLAAGADLRPCPVDEHGLQVERLPSDGGNLKTVYVTPSHQFPAGGVLSLPRRLALLEWAAAHRVVVLEDDYDSEFRYDARPIEAMSALDTAGVVIYLGSFAKTLYPSLRMGFLVVPDRWAPLLERAKWLVDRGAPTFDQLVLADFIRDGHYERHLRRMSRRYSARREALVDALHRHLGDRIEIQGASAGAHLVVWLDDVDAGALGGMIEAAAANGVGLYSIAPYYLTPPRRAGLLFGYGSVDAAVIDDGVRRFADAVNALTRLAG